MKDFKKKTVHRVVTENDVVVSDEVLEVTDWDGYWIFDQDAQPQESIIGIRYFFDKDLYPAMEHAQNACKVEIFEMEREREAERRAREDAMKARRRALREERKQARSKGQA